MILKDSFHTLKEKDFQIGFESKIYADRNANVIDTLKQNSLFLNLKKIKRTLPVQPRNGTPEVLSQKNENLHSHKTCTSLPIATSFVIAPN